MVSETPPNIVIIGAGAIGIAFAATFRDAGWPVALAEREGARRNAVPSELEAQRTVLERAGLRRGGDGPVTVTPDATHALSRADLALECGPENLEIKQAIFADLLSKTREETVLATASSAIPMSRILANPHDQRRCLVAHPANPPSILRVIELVPTPATDPHTRAKAEALFQSAGFATVLLGKEVDGFVMNRLQSAVLREAYRLVDEGVTEVEGVDSIMRMALGPRWALSGPFETAELNTPGGIRAHAARLGPAYKRIGEARGETVDWHPALVDRIEAERRQVLPEAEIPARVRWRADAVARLVAFRDRLTSARDE